MLKEWMRKAVLLPFKKCRPDAIEPKYAHSGDSGMDLYCPERVWIPGQKATLIDTGIAFDIPDGYEIQVRLRSGVALRYPIVMPNSPGTIDSGYRGSIGIIVFNVSNNGFYIEAGERIAQAVLCPVEFAMLREAESLSDTERGAGGYGHSGRF
ncbi:MAG: dUTP diphosphatase [Desulfovibrio sp.]|nr:dUTP diphosphatase [Desulfovibrio sp.]